MSYMPNQTGIRGIKRFKITFEYFNRPAVTNLLRDSLSEQRPCTGKDFLPLLSTELRENK